MDELKFGDTRLPERFWNRHTVDSQGCWVWNSGKSIDKEKGRAFLKFKGKRQKNYVVTCDLVHGPLPTGMTRSHTCPGGGNKLCANPKHILYESNADNCARSRTYSFEYPRSGLDHDEYNREYFPKWAEENKERIRAYARDYSREYYRKNREKIREYQREYHAKNKAKK